MNEVSQYVQGLKQHILVQILQQTNKFTNRGTLLPFGYIVSLYSLEGCFSGAANTTLATLYHPHRLLDSIHHLPSDVPAGIGSYRLCGASQLPDNSLETHAGNVPESFRVREHVGTERVDDDLDLTVLDLLDQRPKAIQLGECIYDNCICTQYELQIRKPRNYTDPRRQLNK